MSLNIYDSSTGTLTRLDGYVSEENLVHKSSAETITGAKTFSGDMTATVIKNTATVQILQDYNETESKDTGGNLYVEGIVTVDGSDYAERFIPKSNCPKSRFVTLDGEYIRLAGKGEYILGVTSIDPSIVGDARLEGSVEVGLLGKLIVEDDGSCEVNGYCTCGGNGIATKADDGYRVMARIDSRHVKVLVK